MSETETIYQCFEEVREQAAAETEERSWKRAMEVIENPKYIEQANKASKEEQARQAKILAQGRIPTVYDDEYVDDDDDDYDDDYDDECSPVDECYPDDE